MVRIDVKIRGLVEGKRTVTDAEAAEILGTTTGTLKTWRATGRGPAARSDGRTVTYEIANIEEWIAARCWTAPSRQKSRAAA